jgi:monovalent cation/proton antiporter MnhG/PhaG subunit
MSDVIVAFLLLLSGIFILLSAVGLWRFPDLYCRMHATGMASTSAKICSFCAAAIYFWSSGASILIKLACVVIFILLTSPVGAHLIARAGYKRGATPSEKTWHNDYA